MPHTITQEISIENILDYSKALAEDCIISGTYEGATLYAKKTSDNKYNYSLIAHEPKKDTKQILRSSTRIMSVIDFNTLLNIIKEVYKIFSSHTDKSNIITNHQTDNTSIHF